MGKFISFDLLLGISRELNNIGKSSYADYDELKLTGELDKYVEEKNIPAILKEEIKNYLDLLFIDYDYYYKKMQMEKLTCGQLLEGSEYILASYCDDILAYRNLPRMLYAIIKKLDIKEYKYVTLEDLISKVNATFDLTNKYDENRKQVICEIVHKLLNLKYENYDRNKVDFNNKDYFSIWAEEQSCVFEQNDEQRKIRSINDIIWVARDYGDGYGFDVLSHDINTNKEKLIEVKSGRSDNFYLTPNEVAVMRNCQFKNAIYSIHKWTYNEKVEYPYLMIYSYDRKEDILIDQNGEQFELYLTKMYDEHEGKYKDYFGLKVREKEKILVLNKGEE